MSKTYHIFISHSWKYSDAYEKLIHLLDNAEDFAYCDYSVPEDDPIEDAKLINNWKLQSKNRWHTQVSYLSWPVYILRTASGLTRK